MRKLPVLKRANGIQANSFFRKEIKQKCSKEEYGILQKESYQKKKNLDKANKEWLSPKKKQK
jgi:hypothetical protein